MRNTYNKRLAPFFSAAGATQKKTGAKRQNVSTKYWKQMKLNLQLIFLTIILIIISACKKGKGAICNDGWTSSSTGQGTCSWHGGVDHYIDPNEISVGKTIGLIIILIILAYFILPNLNNKK